MASSITRQQTIYTRPAPGLLHGSAHFGDPILNLRVLLLARHRASHALATCNDVTHSVLLETGVERLHGCGVIHELKVS